jgi:D-amino-acid dehydrogenase
MAEQSEFDAKSMTQPRQHFDIVIVGAGVVGIATAYQFAKRGMSVCVVDRESKAGRGASFANGAQLSYAYTDALASPGLLRKLPALALGLDPVFRLSPSWNPELYSWLLAFLANMTTARFEWNTIELLKLSLKSQLAMGEILSTRDVKFDYNEVGKMHLYYDKAAVAAAEATVQLKRSHGAIQEMLSPSAAIAIEPTLAQVVGLAGVLYSPTDAVGDSYQFTKHLCSISEKDLGLCTRFNFDVVSIERRGTSTFIVKSDKDVVVGRRLVVCAGVGSSSLVKQFGVHLPILPMKGYSFTAALKPSSPKISITDTKRKFVFCRLGQRARVAGIAELGASSTTLDRAMCELLARSAEETLPYAVDYESIQEWWAGLRPVTPTSTPIIRWVDYGLALNVGHGMLGWTLAMGAAVSLFEAMPTA